MSTMTDETKMAEVAHCANRAGVLAQDAAGACRTARRLALPSAHDRLLRRASAALETAQEALFELGEEPWPQRQPRHRQLTLP